MLQAATTIRLNSDITGVRNKKPIRKKASVPKTLGVVAQVRKAFRSDNLLATTCGAIMGGIIPISTFQLAHTEIEYSWHGSVVVILVLAGLTFSAKTVWQWANQSFMDMWKATGFCCLLEGIMTLSRSQGLSVSALVLLTAINGIATGVTLSRN